MIRGFGLGIFGLTILAMAGCATVTQEQYFEVVGKPDPITGEVPKAYYKMTVTGQSRMIGKYSLKAGYVSAETLDILQGDIPSIPKADLDEDNIKAIEEMKKILLAKLKMYAELQSDLGGSTAVEHEEQVIAIARQLWVASLNDPDIFSMGRMESADPAQFRKLVFYANAQPIKLDVETYGTQIDSIIEKTSTLAGAMRKRKQAAEARDKARKGQQGALIKGILKEAGSEISPELLDAAIGLFSGMSPEEEGE